jgi:hypothetical protein
MNDKKILIEEVQRMRSMMGLKENYIPKILLNEGPGDLWAIVKQFIEANDAARAGLINQIKSDPAQKRLFDELLNKYKSIIDPSNSIRSIDDLANATRKVQLTNFASNLASDLGNIEKTLSKYGINFATDYSNLARLGRAAAGSSDQAVLQAVKDADPLVGTVISKLETNQLDQLDVVEIQMVWNEAAGLLSRETDPALKRIYQEISDDLEKAYTHKLELENITVEKNNLNTGDIGTNMTVRDQEFQQLYELDIETLKTEYENAEKVITKNRLSPISDDNIAIVNVANQRGIITEDQLSELLTTKKASYWKLSYEYGKETKKALYRANGEDKLKLKVEAEKSAAKAKYQTEDSTKWPPDVRSRIGIMEAIVKDDFEDFLKAKALVDPRYRGITSNYPLFGVKEFGGKTLGQAYEHIFGNLNPFSSRLDDATKLRKKTMLWKSLLFTVAGVPAFMLLRDLSATLGIAFGWAGLETGITEAFLKDMVQNWSMDGYNQVRSLSGDEAKACEIAQLPWCGNGIPKEDFVVIDPSLNIFASRQILMPTEFAGSNAAAHIYKFDSYQYSYKKGSKNIVSATFNSDYVVAVTIEYLESLSDAKKLKINGTLDTFGVKELAPNKKRLIAKDSSKNATTNYVGTQAVFSGSQFGTGKTVTSFEPTGKTGVDEEFKVSFYSNTDLDKSVVTRVFIYNTDNKTWSKKQ